MYDHHIKKWNDIITVILCSMNLLLDNSTNVLEYIPFMDRRLRKSKLKIVSLSKSITNDPLLLREQGVLLGIILFQTTLRKTKNNVIKHEMT